MDKRLERILPRVQKPARYVGGEYNAILKDKAEVEASAEVEANLDFLAEVENLVEELKVNLEVEN